MSLSSSDVNQEISLTQQYIAEYTRFRNLINALPPVPVFTGGPTSNVVAEPTPETEAAQANLRLISAAAMKINPDLNLSTIQGGLGIKGLQNKLSELMTPIQARSNTPSSNTIPPVQTPSVPVQARQATPSIFSSSKPLIIFGIVAFSAVTLLLTPKGSKRK